jgi:hypothetical protein
VKFISISPEDNRYTIREALQQCSEEPVLLYLSWEITKGWKLALDYEVILREAIERKLSVAWVIEDPEKRVVARKAGFPVFRSEVKATTYLNQKGDFPSLKEPDIPPRPKHPWYAPALRRTKPPRFTNQPVWMLLLESIVLLIVLFFVGVTMYLAVPTAEITLHPAYLTLSRIIPISVDPQAETVDLQQGIIPALRIGDEFSVYAEVATTGQGFSFSGRAEGTVLFTNLLGQEYRVPANTIVRTSSGSYPVRYTTTQDIIIPAFGQAEAPVLALEDGPRGNVDAYQVNLVEGVVGFAARVTNPTPITGAESKTVSIVAEVDRERAWEAAAQQVMAIAQNGLQELASTQDGSFLPKQTLVIQASPKVAYTNVVGEQTNTLGLSLSLLITGYAVDVVDTQAVALKQLTSQLPEDYTLTDARFEYGEAAEEDMGPGEFSFFVTAYGLADAHFATSTVEELVLGKSIDEAIEAMKTTLPLSQPPEVKVSPEWFKYVPRLPIRVEIKVVPGQMTY